MTCSNHPNFVFTAATCIFPYMAVQMFARTALRAATKPALAPIRLRAAYATAATSDPAQFSASAVEAMNPRGVEISKAQRIADQGFISGMSDELLSSVKALTDAPVSQQSEIHLSYG
jgi:hypothetical protein